MRIAHVSDIHLSTAPAPRDIGATMEEQEQVLYDVARDMDAQRPDLITIGGDLYEAGSTPELRLIAQRWIGMLRERAPVLIVEGNHEQRRDVDIFDAATEYSLDGACEAAKEMEYCVPFTAGTVWRPPRDEGPRVTVGALPWPRRGDLLAYARARGIRPFAPLQDDGTRTAPDLHGLCAEAMRVVLDGFRLAFAEERARGGVCIILGHLDVAGSRLDNGQPVVGKSFLALSPHDLAATGADVVLLGHIHARQTINGRPYWEAPCPIHYPGALKPTAVGQGSEFGYSVVDVEPGGPVSIAFRPIASVRRLVHLKRYMTASAEHDFCGVLIPAPDASHDLPEGASVRLTASAPESHRAVAEKCAETLASKLRDLGNRVAVVMEIQRAERAETRGADVAAARSVGEKLEEWWRTAGVPEHEDAILDMLAELEEEDKANA